MGRFGEIYSHLNRCNCDIEDCTKRDGWLPCAYERDGPDDPQSYELTQTTETNNMSTFLPEGYEISKKEKKYWKLSEMKDGDNRLRIVMKPIVGWLDWNEKKPVRRKAASTV